MKTVRTLALAMTLGFTCASAANAESYKAVFSGTVGSNEFGPATIDTRNIFDNVSTGDRFTATYFYTTESLTKQVYSAGASTSPFTSARFELNGKSLDFTGDTYQFASLTTMTDYLDRNGQTATLFYNNYYAGGMTSLSVNVHSVTGSLFGADKSFESSFLLNGPTSFDLPSLGRPFFHFGSIGGDEDGRSYLRLNLTSDSVAVSLVSSAVPEASTWMLLITGFGFVAGALRMKVRQRLVATSA